MAISKRSRNVSDIEPFDSFKRRQIGLAKTQNSPGPQVTTKPPRRKSPIRPGSKNHPLYIASSLRDLRPKPSQVAGPSKVDRQAQVHQNSTVFEPAHEHLLEKKPTTIPRYGQLELMSSDGIKSPIIPITNTSSAKQKAPKQKSSSNKVKPRAHDDFARQFKTTFESLKKPRQGPDIPRRSPECFKHSQKRHRKTVPISALLISPKEYCKLSRLAPVALEREEKYNWGHLKKHARLRNSLMKKKNRVLWMSSQAPDPSTKFESCSLKTTSSKHPGDSKIRSNTSSKPKGPPTSPTVEQPMALQRFFSSSPHIENSNRVQPILNNDGKTHVTNHPRPQGSKFFHGSFDRVDSAIQTYKQGVCCSKDKVTGESAHPLVQNSSNDSQSSQNPENIVGQSSAHPAPNMRYEINISNPERQLYIRSLDSERDNQACEELEGIGDQIQPFCDSEIPALRCGSSVNDSPAKIAETETFKKSMGETIVISNPVDIERDRSVRGNHQTPSFENDGNPKASGFQLSSFPHHGMKKLTESNLIFRNATLNPQLSPSRPLNQSRKKSECNLALDKSIQSQKISAIQSNNLSPLNNSLSVTGPNTSSFEGLDLSQSYHKCKESPNTSNEQNNVKILSSRDFTKLGDTDYLEEPETHQQCGQSSRSKHQKGLNALNYLTNTSNKESATDSDSCQINSNNRLSYPRVQEGRDGLRSSFPNGDVKDENLAVKFIRVPEFYFPRRRERFHFMPSYFSTRPNICFER